MANYDGSITLSTKVDTKGIENDVKKLANQFEAATQAVEKQSKKVEDLKARLSGLQSGEITINDKGVSKLQKDFDSTTESIKKTQAEVNALNAEIESIQRNAFISPKTNEPMFTDSEQSRIDEINAKLDKLEPKLSESKQKAYELGVELKNATGSATQAEIDGTKQKLAEAETKLEGMRIKATETESKLKSAMNNTKPSIDSVGESFEKLGNKLVGMAKRVFVFSMLTKGLRSIRAEIGNMLMSDEQFRQSLSMLQGSLYLIAVPIYNAVLPALKAMIKWLTMAVLYVAVFINSLSGKRLKETLATAKVLKSQSDAYKKISQSAGKATKGTKRQTKAAQDLKKATKDVNKELAEFDELLILQQKSVDDIQTPNNDSYGNAGGIGAVGGVDSGLDSLSKLLESGDLKKLQEFEKWMLDNKDNIKLALEIGKWVLFSAAIGKAIKWIGELLGWFKKKDSGLSNQTKKTQEETDAVEEMSSAFSMVPSLVYSIIPALNGANQSERELLPTFEDLKEKAYALSPAFDGVTASAYELSPSIDIASNSGKNLTPVLDTATESAYSLSPAFDVATSSSSLFSPAIDVAKSSVESFKTKADSVMPTLENTIKSAFLNSKSNVEEFSTSSESFDEWAESVRTNSANASFAIATNIYNALVSAGDNINSFITTTSSNFKNWASSVATNVSNAAKTIAKNWGNALASAWENFKNFMSATGEKVSGFWKKHSATIITVTLTAAAVAGVIALSPYTGGASLAAIPALAQGAVIPPNREFMAILGDQRSGTNIEAPLSTIEDAVRNVLSEGNYGGNQTIILELDGREVGRTFGKVIQNENNRIGTSFVKTKLVFG